MADCEKAGLLGSGPEWGSIQDVVNAPLIGVTWDDSWLSAFLMWVTLPLGLIQGIFVGLCKSCFVFAGIGSSWIPGSASLCSTHGSVKSGNHWLLTWNWWRFLIGALVAFIANKGSNFLFSIWEWEAFGKGQYWWHGEALYMWTYKDCQKILKSQQRKKSAFGAASSAACIPDLFASNLLIFLSNEGGPDTEWAALRRALHVHFTDHESESYSTRINQLRAKVAEDWPNPQLKDLQDAERLRRSVAKCIFYMMFNIWLEDTDATIMTGWRQEAPFFSLPRMVQRFIFNIGINRVKTLRIKTVQLIEKYNLQDAFVRMNSSMPKRWQRPTVVKLCDEIMFVVGLAGIVGTCGGMESCAAFLQCRIPMMCSTEDIHFGEFNTPEKMQTRARMDSDTYIREVLRMNPPVTSVIAVFKETVEVMLAGRMVTVPENTCNQYTLLMANRDAQLFPEPGVFKPDRANLNRALTWNGAFGAADEAEYPRICPGRAMSLDITKVIIGHALGMQHEELGRGPSQRRAFGMC